MTEQVSLRHKLVLFKYVLRYFGVSDLGALRDLLEREREGYDADGESYFFGALKGLNLKIGEESLKEYDYNIKSYLDRINKQRSEKIQLKYFQYLAVLFTEIFLDNRFNRRIEFLKELNSFAEKENKESRKDYPIFSDDDISKLAYWMATGSGKTLVMHINWLQFHRYNRKAVANSLLITPNESLSRQHLEELRKSSIPARIFSDVHGEGDVIQVIDIHKLTEEKKGEGVRVEVSSFEGNNLVFVDEGHKGFSGKAWKGLRDKISEIGFTFEYSATFDEAIGSKKDELMNEYAKAIIMDYSYSYFYHDGFGKDFTVLNLESSEYDRHKELILLTNLLSYYQQLKFYQKNRQKLRPFSFERPLWIFVGNSVSGQKGEKFDEDTLSDLQFVVAFLNKFLINRTDFVKRIDDITNDRITLTGRDEVIVFTQLLSFIKNSRLTAEELYDDMLEVVFNSESSGKLELFNIVDAEGEVGLRVSNSPKYFALVFIGDVSSFKKRLEAKHELIVQDDSFSGSLFNTINEQDSPINVLIGSKKFIEGWNSFRVSSMGLLNMGRSKGSQVIQLFGRGVRLRGYNHLMKRSTTLIREQILDRQEVPGDLSYLETLNIFGIRADYVDVFRRELEEEGISEEEVFDLEIRKNMGFLKKRLINIRQRGEEEFLESVTLEYTPSISTIEIDLRPQFKMFASSESQVVKTQTEGVLVPLHDYLDYFDWDAIYFALYDFKQQKGFYNLHFDKTALIAIMREGNYKITFDRVFDTTAFSQLDFMGRVCIRVLQKYATQYYNIDKRRWVTNNLEYAVLSKDNENFQDYKIMIDKGEEELINEIRKLLKDRNMIYRGDRKELPSVVFDRHLYQPLLIRNKKLITIPTGLNEGEERLVKDLRAYFLSSNENDKIKKVEFYLFRNLSRRGIGFFAETNNFYPDFILWAVRGNKQKIAFIDPKGLIHAPGEKMAKIEVRKTLKDIESKLGRKDVELTSFIIAGEDSTLDKIKGLGGMTTKAQFEENHVLFQEDKDYVDKIISRIV